MDEPTAAALTGYTSLLATIVKLLVDQKQLTAPDVRNAVESLVERADRDGAPAGFEAASRHFLAIMETWSRH